LHIVFRFSRAVIFLDKEPPAVVARYELLGLIALLLYQYPLMSLDVFVLSLFIGSKEIGKGSRFFGVKTTIRTAIVIGILI
jgi:hypothetical protein